ncbi:Spo0E family sporulation regulatory protein-aspartic acid phosphatase [Bacillus suaedaesalsae]|uniref:Spo0E family sporulation regulatory protein-aspartic acid phosphatase n=1 Tax=Bacillus suaedaesalsae TaxID=2810349 RepID=A0ABS2DLW3_9BACI|nr:Spo0E family sporulation regulatory protein-aspartic acid phosphatase [Bacillus suaedaesalsae]MBM6619474.1 Spo0E family sporulation regulatory protein-aspartic acid phosphatase [Bacillus suaedaesalsae]
MDIDKLKKAIEKQREEMTSLGLKYGLTNCHTVKSSQQLDQLLNQLEYISKTKMYK